MICIGWPSLSDAADTAAILTAVAALGAWLYYVCMRVSKRWRLERYLRDKKANAPEGKVGQHTLIHLMANCGMNESDVLDGAFRSKRIKPTVSEDEKTGHADRIFFEYHNPN